MGSLGGFYLGDHESQFDGSTYARSNCTPTAGANGADNATGGRVDKTGGFIRNLVKRSEESDPTNPGWSLVDLDLAMARLQVGYTNRSGTGWAALVVALSSGHYIVVQGDSDQFSNGTCSGAFDGDHCIGVHPAYRVVNGLRQRWIDDGICPSGRWEYEYILHRYAAKLDTAIRWGFFTTPVPRTTPGPRPTTGTLHIAAHAVVRQANFAASGCIVSWSDRVWGSKASKASARKPITRKTCSGATATVAYVVDGAFKGRYVHIGAGVTWTA